MLTPARHLVPILAAAAIACSAADPDVRFPEWQDAFDSANRATAAGQHDAAITIAKTYLQEHPDNVDGHVMVANASAAAAEALSDQRRSELYQQAATHYSRVLELSRNPNFRVLAITGIVEAYSSRGANKPEERERYARMLVDEAPTNFANYRTLVHVLTENKKYDEVTTVLEQSRQAMAKDADGVGQYGATVQQLAVFTPGFPQDSARKLVASALEMTEQALGTHGRTERLLMNKGVLLRAQADLETDETRKTVLYEEMQRTFDELDRLQK